MEWHNPTIGNFDARMPVNTVRDMGLVKFMTRLSGASRSIRLWFPQNSELNMFFSAISVDIPDFTSFGRSFAEYSSGNGEGRWI
jgi:cytosine/uracil/thiamine/allantoin permease